MPRETYCDLAGLFDLQVGWKPGPAGHVQLGIESHDGRSIAECLASNGEVPAEFTGLWGTFDRSDLNRLIRTLRRARDAVYGADA